MHLAYSAINTNNDQSGINARVDNKRLLRYQAYQQTCEKYQKEIAAIQKHIPGWRPKFK